jgi:hypothetical protein
MLVAALCADGVAHHGWRCGVRGCSASGMRCAVFCRRDQNAFVLEERHAPSTHGEEATMGKFAVMLSGTKVEMPTLGQSFEL